MLEADLTANDAWALPIQLLATGVGASLCPWEEAVARA
jgi:hypothetical protein